MKQVTEMPHERIAHAISFARGEELHDEHVAVAIDDDAGESVAIAIASEQAVAIGVIVDDQLGRSARASLQPALDELRESTGVSPHASIRTAIVVAGWR